MSIIFSFFDDIKQDNNDKSDYTFYRTTGIIFIFSGYGTKDSIITSDGIEYPILKILKMFNGENCPHFVNCPKIFIFDCCRGNQNALAVVCYLYIFYICLFLL